MGPQPYPQRLTPGVCNLAQMWAKGAQTWEPTHLYVSVHFCVHLPVR